MVRRFGSRSRGVVVGDYALVIAGAILAALASPRPAAAQEQPTIEQMRARDVLAAPEGELAAWQAFTALVLADPASSPQLVAESRLGLANALLYAQQKEAGLAEWQEAARLSAVLPQQPFQSRLQSIGSLLLTEAGRLDEAEALAAAALATAEAAGPAGLIDQALAQNAQGMIAFARNDLPAAEAAFCTARDLGLAAPQPYHAMVVNDASSCAAVKFYLERPDTLAAMRMASDHAHAHLPPDHPKMGNVLNSAYAVLLRYGRYAEAEPLIRRHLELERNLRNGDADEVYDPLSLLARALELRGAYADAEEVFRAAADMADRLRSATQPWARGRARGNLAVVLARQGRLEEAEAEARIGVERLVADLAPGDSNIGSGRVTWADQLDRLGRREEALAQVDEGLALLIAEYPPEHSEVIAARLIRARVLAGLGRVGEALEQSRSASGQFAKQMFDLAASETDRVALSRVVPRAFADHLAVALAAGDMGEAVQAAQLLLLSEQGVSNARIAAGSLARQEGLGAAVDRLEAARAAVAADEEALAAAQASGSADAADLAPRLAAARDEAAAAQGALLAAFPQYAELARPQVPTLDQLQASLSSGEALVLPLALPDRAVTVTVTHDGVAWGETAMPPTHVAALAERVRASAQAVGTFDVAAAQALHDVVFPAGVRGLTGSARFLLFPASGYLARLSPAVLLSGAADAADLRRAPWLVRRAAIRVVADLARLGTARQAPGAGDFLGVGAPDQLPPALMMRADTLPPLPRAAAELAELAQVVNPPKATLLAGADASEAAFATLELADFGVIAFATHGLVGGEVAGLDEPALVLAGQADAGAQADGLLTASEIAGLKLNADWVILSACDTAAGESAGAPGYSGLARAFASAGAGSLMLSHWRVRDDAAAFISVETLRRALPRSGPLGQASPGAARAAALQRAQLVLMARRDLADAGHPALWAPFVLLTN